MEYIRAFLVGGLICAAVQLLLDRTKLMPGRIMVSLVVTGAVLGFLGIYEPFAQWAGAGATVPLTGFGNTLWKGIARAMGEDGDPGDLQRRLHSQRRGNLRSPGIWVSGLPGI